MTRKNHSIMNEPWEKKHFSPKYRTVYYYSRPPTESEKKYMHRIIDKLKLNNYDC